MKLSPRQIEALRLVAEGKFYPCLAKEEDGWHARWRAVGADNLWVDECVREATMTRLTEDAEDQRHETLHDAWITALRSRTGLVRWADAECAAFAQELDEWAGSAAPDVEARRSIVFRFSDASSVSCRVPRTRRVLKALGQAAYVWGPLRALACAVDDRSRLVLALSAAEAEDFVRRGARDLTDAGYSVEGLPPQAVVSLEAEVDEGDGDGAREHPAVRLVVKVAGQPVTAEEIRFLLDQGSTLVFFRDRWIEVDRNILREGLRALEKGCGAKPNLLSFALGVGHVGNLEVERLKAHGWLRGLVGRLRAAGRQDVLSRPDCPGLKARLRPYQEQGVAWMKFLTDHGFGALLADDMGLGKTVQAIAWILADRAASRPSGPVLVLAPLTLLANWRHELLAFAPSLRVHVHQGESRCLSAGFRRTALEQDVVLTSYTLLVRDYSSLSEVAWSALVLDEAQAVKNPDTQVAKAVRALAPAKRIALTGTPIENSVADVWALEDFLNPGFLGDRASFRARFARPLAMDANAAVGVRLRQALEPFVLRRLKSEKAIAAELGEKREIREYCALDAAARRAYEAALAAYRATERSPGDALALLTELKLACDGVGKLERLAELLGQVFEAGESALVFTQYAKVGAWLQAELSRRFGRSFPFLHGGLSAAARQEEVRAFNRRGPRAFILSLRAGGFGLNLTKATHVIHFDRWWNPAVENQATDRAHRIGQTRTVFVHLMVTEGTIEERVDGLLSRKGSLAALLSDGSAFWQAVSLGAPAEEGGRE